MANKADSHIAVRIVYEELRQTDEMKRYEQNSSELDSAAVSSDDHLRRLHDHETHGDDRRNPLHFLYVNRPPQNRIERQLEKDGKLEEFRTDKLRSRLMREVDPDNAQGHYWTMVRKIEDQGAKLLTFAGCRWKRMWRPQGKSHLCGAETPGKSTNRGLSRLPRDSSLYWREARQAGREAPAVYCV